MELYESVSTKYYDLGGQVPTLFYESTSETPSYFIKQSFNSWTEELVISVVDLAYADLMAENYYDQEFCRP